MARFDPYGQSYNPQTDAPSLKESVSIEEDWIEDLAKIVKGTFDGEKIESPSEVENPDSDLVRAEHRIIESLPPKPETLDTNCTECGGSDCIWNVPIFTRKALDIGLIDEIGTGGNASQQVTVRCMNCGNYTTIHEYASIWHE